MQAGNTIRVTTQTHKRVSILAKRHGMKVGGLADRVLAEWCLGRVFELPVSVPRRKARG